MPRKPGRAGAPETLGESDARIRDISVRVLMRLLRRLDDDEALGELTAASALSAVGQLLDRVERIRGGNAGRGTKPMARFPDLKALLENPAPQRSLERLMPDEEETGDQGPEVGGGGSDEPPL